MIPPAPPTDIKGINDTQDSHVNPIQREVGGEAFLKKASAKTPANPLKQGITALITKAPASQLVANPDGAGLSMEVDILRDISSAADKPAEPYVQVNKCKRP